MPLITLDYWDIAIAALLLLVNAGLSIWLQLGLARDTLIAAARMVVQLGIIGLVLKALFATVSPWLTALFALAMVLFAGREAMARQERRLAGGAAILFSTHDEDQASRLAKRCLRFAGGGKAEIVSCR